MVNKSLWRSRIRKVTGTEGTGFAAGTIDYSTPNYGDWERCYYQAGISNRRPQETVRLSSLDVDREQAIVVLDLNTTIENGNRVEVDQGATGNDITTMIVKAKQPRTRHHVTLQLQEVTQ